MTATAFAAISSFQMVDLCEDLIALIAVIKIFWF
jgi:hypothetical protein